MSNDNDDLFRELFRKFYKDVVRLLMRYGADRETARDLAQDTFTRVYRGLKEYRGEGHRTWIWTIAKRQWLNHLRRQKAQRREPEVPAQNDQLEASTPDPAPWTPVNPNPYQRLLMRESIRRLSQAVDELPPRLRQCFVLRYRDGFKYREIAAFMGISLDTVKDQVREGRSRIKERLGGIDLEDSDHE